MILEFISISHCHLGFWGTIKVNEYIWEDLNISNDLGKEAAKTILALDYYLKSCDSEQNKFIFNNTKLSNICDKSEKDPELSDDMGIQRVNLIPKYNKRYENSRDITTHNMDECYRTLNNHIKQNKSIDLYATGGGFRFKDLQVSRNKGVSTSSTSKRSNISKSLICRNRMRKENRSLFGSYVEEELRKFKLSENHTPNLPDLIINSGPPLL